ncbi:transposase [Bradyrhizobium sp. LVM 105]|uniref:Transposase n=1 Tax=Bradyrhizobium frederickii TaxID=2560054 RepID=A0A4Y9NJI6_9BRAD|nr:transposase [Bradyrhizobium sp. LVM 105]TFV29566.1 transposase [Bradyrhizobium frederickii]TFV68020.1 transposase [Bradyrhizobium frederickii]
MKKHSRQEIKLKLARADELARAGSSQVAICKTLGVSVMTLHRWRKLPLSEDVRQSSVGPNSGRNLPPPRASLDEMRRALEELTVENRRLRKLVTDLMLEKMTLEEASAPSLASGRVHDP